MALTLTERSRRLEQRQNRLDEEKAKQAEIARKRRAQNLRTAGSCLEDEGILDLPATEFTGYLLWSRAGYKDPKIRGEWQKLGQAEAEREEQEKTKVRIACVITYDVAPNSPTRGALKKIGMKPLTPLYWTGKAVRGEAEELALASGGKLEIVGAQPELVMLAAETAAE